MKIGKNVKWPATLNLKIGDDTSLEMGDNVNLNSARIELASGTKLKIGDGCSLAGTNIFINAESTVEIGSRTTMQVGRLRTGRNQSVVIGADCMFSWDIVFLPHDGHLIWDINSGECINNTMGARRASVRIGDHVWVGGETVIMPETVIGSGSICGYRSLAKGTYPNNCIIAGSPARVVRKDIAWSRANISYDDKDFYAIDENFRKPTEEICNG